jgi:hypothetical protein
VVPLPNIGNRIDMEQIVKFMRQMVLTQRAKEREKKKEGQNMYRSLLPCRFCCCLGDLLCFFLILSSFVSKHFVGFYVCMGVSFPCQKPNCVGTGTID